MERTAGSTSSTSRPGAADDHREIAIGRVVGAHGLRGVLRVRALPGAVEVLQDVPRVRVARREADPEARRFAVSAIAPGRRGELRLTLSGLADRDGAEALRGCLVLAEARHLAPPAPGEVYGYELVGCRVEGTDGVAVGTVREIWSTGGADVLVVAGEGGAQHLLPAAPELLETVDVEARRIVIEIAPGLLDPA